MQQLVRYPIRGTFADCCASATNPIVSCTATTRIDKTTAALCIAHLVLLEVFITHTAVAKHIIYLRRGTRFGEVEKCKFDVRLN